MQKDRYKWIQILGFFTVNIQIHMLQNSINSRDVSCQYITVTIKQHSLHNNIHL